MKIDYFRSKHLGVTYVMSWSVDESDFEFTDSKAEVSGDYAGSSGRTVVQRVVARLRPEVQEKLKEVDVFPGDRWPGSPQHDRMYTASSAEVEKALHYKGCRNEAAKQKRKEALLVDVAGTFALHRNNLVAEAVDSWRKLMAAAVATANGKFIARVRENLASQSEEWLTENTGLDVGAENAELDALRAQRKAIGERMLVLEKRIASEKRRCLRETFTKAHWDIGDGPMPAAAVAEIASVFDDDKLYLSPLPRFG